MKRNTKQPVPDGLPLGPGLTQQQAEAIYQLGKEAVVFALLELAKMAVEQRPVNLPAAIAAGRDERAGGTGRDGWGCCRLTS